MDETIQQGSHDEHTNALREAMLKMQDCTFSQYEPLIHHTYDWAAVERMTKDIGLLTNYEQLEKILKQDSHFHKVPKASQNLSDYRSIIASSTIFPNWQCGDPIKDGTFRKFMQIGKTTYALYVQACKQKHIKPYGEQ